MNPSPPSPPSKPQPAIPPGIKAAVPIDSFSGRALPTPDVNFPTGELTDFNLGAVDAQPVSAQQTDVKIVKGGSTPKAPPTPPTASKQAPAVLMKPATPVNQPVVAAAPTPTVTVMNEADLATEGIADPKEYARIQALTKELAPLAVPIVMQVVDRLLDMRVQREENASLRFHLRLWKMLVLALIIFLSVVVALVWLRRHEVAALLDRDLVQNSHTTNQPVATDNAASPQPQSQPAVPTHSVVTVEVGETRVLPFDAEVPKGTYKIEGRVGSKKVFTFVPDGNGWKGSYLEPLEATRVELRFLGARDASSVPASVQLRIVAKE